MFRVFASRRRTATSGRDVSDDYKQSFIERHITMTADLGKPKPMQHCTVKGVGEWDIPQGVKLLPLLQEVAA